MRLYKALGDELALNRAHMHVARTAAFVTMIDDVPVPLPANEGALEALLVRLGEDSLIAVAAAIREAPAAKVVAEAGN